MKCLQLFLIFYSFVLTIDFKMLHVHLPIEENSALQFQYWKEEERKELNYLKGIELSLPKKHHA